MIMYDVAIIGAGLAGSSAAICLAQHNHKVLLLEAGKYPRSKVCGEFLSPEAIGLFRDMQFLEHLLKLRPARIDRIRITAPNGSEWCRDLPFPALGISRFALDKALVDYAKTQGVELIEGMRVNEFEGNLKDGFQLNCQIGGRKEQFQAASLIAASGKRSNLDRFLKQKQENDEPRFIGLKQHFMGKRAVGEIELHVFKGGYCGFSQIEDGITNVCLLVREDVFQEASGEKHKIPHFIEWMANENRQIGEFLSDAKAVYPDWLSISQVSLQNTEAVEGDVLLAGDAVGMIAPLAGDGMAMALHSGLLAAAALDGFLRGLEDSDMMKSRYQRQWQKNFSQRLRLGRVLQSVMLEPKLLAAGLHFLNQFPSLGDFLVRQTRDLALLE